MLNLIPLFLACSGGVSDHTLTPISSPADLDILTPEAGVHGGQGSLDVVGTWTGLDGVTVNGAIAAMQPDGSFHTSMQGANGITVVEALGFVEGAIVARDARATLMGPQIVHGETLKSALVLTFDEEGLHRVGESAGRLWDDRDTTASVVANNPVYEDTIDLYEGWLVVDAQVLVDDVQHAEMVLGLTPIDGAISVEFTLPDLTCAGRVLFNLADLAEDELEFVATASGAVGTASLHAHLEDGQLVLSARDATVTLQDFTLDVDGVSDFLELAGLWDDLLPTFEAALATTLTSHIAPAIEESINGLTLAQTITIMEREVSLDLGLGALSLTGAGLSLALDANVSTAGEAVHTEIAGPLHTPGPLSMTPADAPISLAVHDDLFNIVLHDLWRVGAFDLSLSTEDDSLSILTTTLFDASAVHAELSLGLPPVFHPVDGEPRIEFGELDVLLETPDGTPGEHTQVWLAGHVLLTPRLTASQMTLDLATPSVMSMVRESDWSTDTLEASRLFDETVPMDLVFALLGDIELPLPDLSGFVDGELTPARSDTGTLFTLQ